MWFPVDEMAIIESMNQAKKDKAAQEAEQGPNEDTEQESSK